MGELVAVAEIAELLNVTRQRVYQLIAADPHFPQPLDELSVGRVWRRLDIEAWARDRKAKA